MNVLFSEGKFKKNKGKVAEFLEVDSEVVTKAFFEKLASLIVKNAIFKGAGTTEGSTMFIGKTTMGFMIVSVVEEEFSNGTNGVTLFGVMKFFSDKKADLNDVKAIAKSKGLVAV